MKKTAQKILIALLCCVLAAALAITGVIFMYYPHYRKNKQNFDISQVSDDREITVMSANVRCFSPTDLGKKSWFYRADLVVKNIAVTQPDIIGFQEVMSVHYKYLTDTLKGYDSVITYRDDSIFSESCPVFYNTSRFTLLDKGSFWLSETPEIMSKDWGSACYRICSYVILEEKQTEKQLVVFNTHLDHVSDLARINGVNVVLDKIEQFGNLPSIIMGDLNCGENSDTYRAATKLFDDAKYRTENPPKGPTYQDYGKRLDAENIDYFMISKTGIEVNNYQIIDYTYTDGAPTATPLYTYPSDHFPIVMKITLS